MKKKNELAIFGGEKTIRLPFKKYNSIGDEEIKAVNKVMKSGELSKFIGAWHDDFLGGPKVRELELMVQEMFSVKHAISVNSWTSGLIAAVGSLEIEPQDEIILPAWTMSACAASILHWNALPVFADISPTSFNLDYKDVEKKITKRTKAIIAPDIFGQSADLFNLKKLARKYSIKIISDSAQAPYSEYKSKFTGTQSDIGGFSLNYHKHINTGEGGIIVTNDKKLAERMQLIRNHGESAVGGMKLKKINNLIGFNFRMGEIEAAIAIEQFKKLPEIVKHRQHMASILRDGLSELGGLKIPDEEISNTHVYYIFPMVLNLKLLKINRVKIIKALEAEGVEGLMAGYQNLHLLPMFQKKIAYGNKGFPWPKDTNISYKKGTLPISEELHSQSFLGFNFCMFELDEITINKIIKAFHKVWANLDNI